MGKRTCSIDTCEGPVVGRGWCSRHYQAWQKYGDPLAGGHKTGRRRGVCSIEDCDEVRAGLGWCSAHYNMWRRHGDPEWVPGPGARRTYALDDYFFDNIDTEAKAYWLGFITADGCVQAGRYGASGWQRHQLYVKLKASDAGHLEKLKADMAAENPVRFVPQAGQAGPAVDIALSSRQLTESLIRLGVTPRKSLTATPWTGPAHLMRHYWRGMFDGDGSIGRNPAPRPKWRLKLVGTEACVEAFRAWAAPISGSAARIRPKDNIWTWTAGGLASPQAIAREMYAGATVYLDRKYALALQLMATPVRHRTWLAPEAPGLF
jgi:hypothetical protein